MDLQVIKVDRDYYSHAENFIALETQIMRVNVVRQYSIGSYLADFYFPEINVVLEIDGYFHNNPEAEKHDDIRNKFMNQKGFTVVRVTGKLAKNNPSGIINILRLFPKGRTFFLTSDRDIAVAQECAMNESKLLSDK